VKAGQPLSPRAVRRTVQLLYGLGRFGNVVVRTDPAADGQVAVVVECLPRRAVATLEVNNAAPRPVLDGVAVLAASGLAVGEELWPGRAEGAAERVRAAYERLGWRAARVEVRSDGERDAKVTIRVEEGRPTRVASLALGPDPGLQAARLAEVLATRQGAVLAQDALDADVRAVRARLRKEGYLRARVGAPTVRVDGELARIEIAVEAGPRVEFRFPGAAAFSSAELRAQLGLENEQLDAPAIEAAAGRVRAFYQANGFAAVRVAAAELAVPGHVAVVFRVDEGRRYRTRAVRFPSAAQRSEKWLQARLEEALAALPAREGPAALREDAERLARASGSPASVRSPAPVDVREVWDPASWDQATLRLVELYREDGFLAAAHEGTRVALDARAGTIDVEIRIREGVRTRVEAVAFEGNQTVPLPELVREARLSPGDPLSFGAIDATRNALLALYARRGRLYARVLDAEEFTSDRAQATVRFRIDEGPEVRIGSVVVAGARRTREEVVRDALALHPGDVYDPEAAARSQASLLRLGVFRSVGLRLADPDVPEATKDVTVELSERPWRSVGSGVGFSLANGPRAFVELSQPNLFGRALELVARAKVNYPLATFRPDLAGTAPVDRVEGRADVGLHDPKLRLLGLPLGGRFDAIAEDLHRPSYSLQRGSTIFGVDLPATSRVTLSLQYEVELDNIHRRNSVVILTQADVANLRNPDGTTALNTLRPIVALDYRDSSIHPRRGWLATGVADYVHSISFPGTSSFTHMLKLAGAVSGYLPIGSSSVLALSARGGRILSLSPDSLTIASKRFFLGGASSMRGYGEDGMIPEDVRAQVLDQVRACASSASGVACSDAARQLASGQAVTSEGGEYYMQGKMEVRFPLRESVEAGLFVDVGNLWLDPRLGSVADLRLNFGFGLRFLTPIGPAVLDLGVNPAPDTRLGEAYVAPHFSIGLF
jgi:outer membrane protein assembly factor BamA